MATVTERRQEAERGSPAAHEPRERRAGLHAGVGGSGSAGGRGESDSVGGAAAPRAPRRSRAAHRAQEADLGRLERREAVDGADLASVQARLAALGRPEGWGVGRLAKVRSLGQQVTVELEGRPLAVRSREQEDAHKDRILDLEGARSRDRQKAELLEREIAELSPSPWADPDQGSGNPGRPWSQLAAGWRLRCVAGMRRRRRPGFGPPPPPAPPPRRRRRANSLERPVPLPDRPKSVWPPGGTRADRATNGGTPGEPPRRGVPGAAAHPGVGQVVGGALGCASRLRTGRGGRPGSAGQYRVGGGRLSAPAAGGGVAGAMEVLAAVDGVWDGPGSRGRGWPRGQRRFGRRARPLELVGSDRGTQRRAVGALSHAALAGSGGGPRTPRSRGGRR